ncbi:MAG TPA: ABC transporter permease, partial [Salinarimonas sp.]|nr:ABC transporter permease [Salinarimonas sp.]
MAAAASAVQTRGFNVRSSLILAAPAALALLLFFVVPLSSLVSESVMSPRFGAQNYVKALTSDLYVLILWRTIRLSIIVTVLALLLGYPVALTMSRVSPRVSLLLAVCVLLPLWTAVLVRSYAWIVLL